MNIKSTIYIAACMLFGLQTKGLAATYEKTESDYGSKTVFFVRYEIVNKSGVDLSGKAFQYQDGYVVYTETPSGSERKAVCLADICEKWIKNPKSFEKYIDRRASVTTDERLVDAKDSDESEECFTSIKFLKK